MKNITMLRIASLALAITLIGGLAQTSNAADNVKDNGLTQEQMAKMDKMVDKYYSDMDSTHQALTVKRAELSAQLNSVNPDAAKVQSLSREIGELEGKLLAARTQLNSQLRKEGLPGCPGLGNGRGGYHRGHGYGNGCYGAGCGEMRGHSMGRGCGDVKSHSMGRGGCGNGHGRGAHHNGHNS